MDGATATIMCERESSDAAGAYPITPSTPMGELWAIDAANGRLNTSGNPLIFIEPEGEHAAAAVTAGLAMTGLRSTNFSSGQGVAYMHESLYAAVGKRLTYVLNIGCRAITKASLNVHAGHDDYHAVDDTGFFQMFAKDVQQVADLTIIAHRVAELALTPGIVGQDGFLTTHLIETLKLPERELIAEYLGRPDDMIDCPTPSQRMLYGSQRRRIPEIWSVDNPVLAGSVQNQDSYMQSVAGQRPFFFDHIEELALKAMDEYYALTGRQYNPIETINVEDADYLIIGQGSVIPNAEAVADYLRKTRKIKIGVVNMTMFRPFPGRYLGPVLKGKKGVTVLERIDQPLAEDLPLIKEIRGALAKCVENGLSPKDKPYPEYEAYTKLKDMPPLYSGSFGMGSRDLQPEGIIGTVENMLPEGKRRKMFYLSVDFIRGQALTPKEELHQQSILDGYPEIAGLSVRGSENPNLMPENSIAVRIHSIGGWGAMATGKNLTMTLADILGYHIKSNPKYGSEKKGQPTTYYLAVAPEPIKVNCEYFYVDVVLSPDPNVFKHSNPLAGLKKGGVFIIQSDLGSADEVWNSFPRHFRQTVIDNEYRVFYLDAFKIAKEEATDAELQFRMQGTAFQGAFFAVSPVKASADLTDDALFDRVEAQLQAKFGSKGANIVAGNLQVVRRGFESTTEIETRDMSADDVKPADTLPMKLKTLPASEAKVSDIHRFWEQTGYFYKTGKGNDGLADPFASMSLVPAATGVFKDMTDIRFEFPEWIEEKCTGCGNCWAVCPDSSLPGLVNEFSQIFQSAITSVEKRGQTVKHLRKAVRPLEKNLRLLIDESGENASVQAALKKAIDITKESADGDMGEMEELNSEFVLFYDELKDFQFSVTRPFYTLNEQDAKGSGGLLSITVNPYTCKGCMECIQVCGDDALRSVRQTEPAVDIMKKNWDFWQELPTTPQQYFRVDNLEEGIGALETILLDKAAYETMVGGDGACLGCAEKTVLHLFTATVASLMQPRVKAHLVKIEDLIQRLEQYVKLRLAVNVDDTSSLQSAVASFDNKEFTLSDLSDKMNRDKTPVDAEWLNKVTSLVSGLKDLHWKYSQGITGQGRSDMGFINATGCSSVWGSTYPLNPYPFPWANNLFQDSPSMAMGIFEGHMRKMGEGFKIIRQAEHELDGDGTLLDLSLLTWRSFTDAEFFLCPPVVSVGGDGAMYDIGFQNLSRMLMSGFPIKVMVLDTQVYSNTGGQACTSGFVGQVSDMAVYGKVNQGKEEIRKEIGLIGMAHRTSYILQSSMASTSHLLEGFIEGLMSKRPALFNIYTSCQPEHGMGDDMALNQAKLALESRAYPFIKYNPDAGSRPDECFDLDGNPEPEADWPSYSMKYLEQNGQEATMDISMTFADFAATEGRFRKHFKAAPRDTWDDEKMVTVSDFLKLDEDDQEDVFPYIWATDNKGFLTRLIVGSPIIESCKERLDYWNLLKNLAGLDAETVDEDGLKNDIRSEMVGRFTQALLQLSNGAN